ncbi:hypothetical protein Tco_1551789, partial [Tanacetum coccineum]
TYKQSYNAKLKYALENQPKITTGQINEKMFEFKIKKPEESSSNWKPWHKDWDATTSNHLEENDAINDDDKYRYNRKGFLEDDESSDDSILIVVPGWDDYSLQTLKSNRPIPLCPEARRASIELRDQAYENSLIYKEKTKKLNDSKIKNRIFNVGDQVLLMNSRLKIFSGKLKSRWSGPFTIIEVYPYGTAKLSHTDGSNFKVNCHRLKHYYGGDTPPLVIPDLQTFPKDN